jgi:hypothetical protein
MPKATLYDSLLAPDSWRLLDGELTDIIPRHVVISDKNSAPLISPAVIRPGGQRLDQDVLHVSFAVLDIDGVREEELVNRLPYQYAFLCYTSYSHRCACKDPTFDKKGKCTSCYKKPGAFRLAIPLSRPVLPKEWKDFWVRLNQMFDNLGDPKCKGLSHAYFVPAVRTQVDLALAHYDWNDGETVNVDTVLALPAAPRRAAIPVAGLSLQGFRDAARRQKRHMKARFDALIAGDPFAQPSERNATSFQMMRDLARNLPDVNPDALRPFLAPSIDAMEPDNGFNLDVVIRQFATAQNDLAAERAEEENQAREAARLDVERAFSRTPYAGRSEPYTAEEIQAFAAFHGAASMEHLWVLQRGQTFYAWLGDNYYGPYQQIETPATVALAPASSAGVERYTITKNGPILKPWTKLAEQYGTVIEKVMVDLSAQYARFDPHQRVLYEAPCPIREIEPRFDPDIDRWMRLFAAENYGQFLSWMASVPRVKEPTAVLFVRSQRGSGKTMLMNGLGRLWLRPDEEVPEIVDTMVGNKEFNDALTRCPLTVADENFPPNKSAELRRFMQARSHTLRRKFMPVATVIGAPRIIIAANNNNLLKIREVLTADDVEAIGERILYLQPAPEARDFLLSLGDRPRERWVNGNGLAAHCLWLHQNHEYERGSRFLVEGKQGSFHRSLAISTSVSSAICEWLARYLRDPKRADQCDTATALMKDGDLLVSPSGLAQYWELYTTNFRPAPELRDVSTALQALTHRDRRVVKVKNKATHFRVVNMDFLRQWAEDNDWGDLQ